MATSKFHPLFNVASKRLFEKIQMAVKGVMCPEQAEKLKIISSHLNSLELCKDNLRSAILYLAEQFRPQIELVFTMPGIQFLSENGIIAEIGVGMSVFPTAKQLCSWVDLLLRTTRVQEKEIYTYPPCWGVH